MDGLQDMWDVAKELAGSVPQVVYNTLLCSISLMIYHSTLWYTNSMDDEKESYSVW